MRLSDAIAVNGQPLSDISLTATDFYEWQVLDITCVPQPNITSAVLRINDVDLGAPTTTFGDPLWRWHWNPQHAVGHFAATLNLTDVHGSRLIEAFELRIVPRKIDVDQYETLIQAVQRDVYGLIYALSGGRAGATIQAEPMAGRSLIEEYVALVDGHVREALTVTRQIAARPQPALATHNDVVNLAEADHIDAAMLSQLVRGPLDDVAEDVLPPLQKVLRPAGQQRGGPLPSTVPRTRRVETHDVPEHRLLKYVLEVLVWRVGVVRDMLRREVVRRERTSQLSASAASAEVAQTWLTRCNEALSGLRKGLALPMLAAVGSLYTLSGPTHLMRHDPRYRRLYALYRTLRQTPFIAFDSPTLWLPLADLPLLYEQWCTLQVLKALLPLGTVEAQQLVAREDDGQAEQRWTLRLQQQQPLLTLKCRDEIQIAVIYQQRYGPQPASCNKLGALDPFVRVPDIAVEVRRSNQAPRVLIFDAKYRVAPDGRVPQDALDDAYAYRGAIGVAGKRATLGAFLLFPGTTALITADQVGALPLVPGVTDRLADLIAQLGERMNSEAA